MTAGQHDHEELRAEIAELKTALTERDQQGDTVTQEAAQAAANAQQAAEVAVTEAAVTRADLEALRDELKAAIADTSRQREPSGDPLPRENGSPEVEPSGVPAAPADLPAPPADETLVEGAPQEAPTVEEKDTKNRPPRKRKSVWWG